MYTKIKANRKTGKIIKREVENETKVPNYILELIAPILKKVNKEKMLEVS